jgi:hypothetical protein
VQSGLRHGSNGVSSISMCGSFVLDLSVLSWESSSTLSAEKFFQRESAGFLFAF